MNAPIPRHLVSPFQVVRDFEDALCAYTGAPYAVTVTSCTAALLLACAYHIHRTVGSMLEGRPKISIPKRTYIGVPMSIIHAGGWPIFREEQWSGVYRLQPLPVWDAARRFRAGMFNQSSPALYPGAMVCVSFHWGKTLGIQQGGAILTNNAEAAAWLKRARFDGRTEGVPPSEDRFEHLGWHCYMAPETAAAGLVRLGFLPRDNPDLAWDDYPDLSTLDIFKGGGAR